MTGTLRGSKVFVVCRLAMACALALAPLGSGCATASLASDTGPRPTGYAWSVARRQAVHVAEEVQFDFVLQDWAGQFVHPLGVADYCGVAIDGDRLETDFDLDGHFRFSYRFDAVQPGQQITVEATAFQRRGVRDFLRLRGQWVRADSTYDEPDVVVGRANIVFTVYQTRVELSLPRPPVDLDDTTGVLTLSPAAAPSVSVFIDRPLRPGFLLDGPGPDGYYHIRYEPTGDQLSATGTTDVKFTIYDVAGRMYEARQVLQTP